MDGTWNLPILMTMSIAASRSPQLFVLNTLYSIVVVQVTVNCLSCWDLVLPDPLDVRACPPCRLLCVPCDTAFQHSYSVLLNRFSPVGRARSLACCQRTWVKRARLPARPQGKRRISKKMH
jgi:hypothetical protein